MRISVLAHGSRGDVQPYLALALGLKRAGHIVRFAANSNFEKLATRYGLGFCPLRFDSFAFLQNQRVQAWLDSDNPLKLALNAVRVIRPTLDHVLKDAWDACQGAEAVIYHSFTLPTGYYIGQMLDVPCLPASLYPVPTRAHPALPLNMQHRLGGTFNLLSHQVLELLGWQVYRSSAKAFWKGNLEIPFTGPHQQLRKKRRPVLCGYSSTVVPAPSDLPDYVYITGYWFLDAPPAWKPNPALVDFLQSGPPPVFVGFASMGNPMKAPEMTQIVLEALALAGQRGLLVAGWSGLGMGITLPDTVFVVESALYSWLLPQMAAIVHHGGAGTTGVGLAAGIPNVVIPHFSDNYFWGRRVAALGAGPEPIPRRRLSAEGLAQAITEAVSNDTMRIRAAAIGEGIQSEDGVARAVEVFHRYVSL
jgi:sterol 3beta-glucosyltransferase